MPAPAAVLDLIQRYEQNADLYRSRLNETEVRLQFINPLFEALGWDVYNKEGYAPDYRDVIHEAAVKVGGATKAPDYSFGIGKDRKFFVEAKRLAVNIKDDLAPAYQLRRYAWNAKLPLSILTNFDGFAVYDAKSKTKRMFREGVFRGTSEHTRKKLLDMTTVRVYVTPKRER